MRLKVQSSLTKVVQILYYQTPLVYLILIINFSSSFYFVLMKTFSSFCFHLSDFIPSITSNVLFSPPWPVLVLQNQQNVFFPSKGWLNWRTESTSQEILRPLSATACSYGGRSLITQACYCCCPPSTSSAEDLTGITHKAPGRTVNMRCGDSWPQWGFWVCGHN